MRRHKTTLEIRKIIHLSRSSMKSIIHKLKKYFADRKKFITRQQFLGMDLSQIFVKKGPYFRYSKNLENKIPSDMY